MSKCFCISVTFLDARFHGRGDGGLSEWPPSPMRLFQAIVAGNGPLLHTDDEIKSALRWLESLPPPTVLAPPIQIGTPCPLYVPNNAMDVVAKAWGRGNVEAGIAEHRTLKVVRPVHLRGGDTIHYLWSIADDDTTSLAITKIEQAIERMVSLGWGIDLVVAQCRVLSSEVSMSSDLERWNVARNHAANTLRCPIPGSLDAILDRHAAFLDRLANDTFQPVPPLTQYRAVGYRRTTDPVARATVVFELRHEVGSFCRYPQRKLIHIAAMVRHLAKEVMQRSPPADVEDDWVERYVVGHRDRETGEHRQFSYLPLPSIGHEHADQMVRRVMIAAPVGDDSWLEHLAARLAGRQLKPENGNEFRDHGPPALIRVLHDQVARRYTASASRWTSVTPVVLPGHDDKKPAKTRKLIEAALAQSGIDQPCAFEWSEYSRFRNSLSAHKYHHDRDTGVKHWQFENVKDYLRGKTWIHLTVTFPDDLNHPGPLTIGAGRHCGFGLMAADGDLRQ